MILGGENFKEIERKKIGKKSEQKQSENRVKIEEKQSFARFHSLKKTSAKWAFCCQTIPQHFGVLCENFRNCESAYGTRVPLRNTGTLISQLRNALRRGKAWFRNKSPIPQHSTINFAAAKCIAKLLRKWHFPAKMAFSCEIGVLLRNLNWPLVFRFSYLYQSFELRKRFQNQIAPFSQAVHLLPWASPCKSPVIFSDQQRRPNFGNPKWREQEGLSLHPLRAAREACERNKFQILFLTLRSRKQFLLRWSPRCQSLR